jgi:hypothetical protein
MQLDWLFFGWFERDGPLHGINEAELCCAVSLKRPSYRTRTWLVGLWLWNGCLELQDSTQSVPVSRLFR